MIKRVFRLTLRAAQGFIDFIFAMMDVPLRCPDYTCVSKRVKSVNVSFKTPTRGEIAHLVIDSTGLKVFGEGEWKVKKHGNIGKYWVNNHDNILSAPIKSANAYLCYALMYYQIIP